MPTEKPFAAYDAALGMTLDMAYFGSQAQVRRCSSEEKAHALRNMLYTMRRSAPKATQARWRRLRLRVCGKTVVVEKKLRLRNRREIC